MIFFFQLRPAYLIVLEANLQILYKIKINLALLDNLEQMVQLRLSNMYMLIKFAAFVKELMKVPIAVHFLVFIVFVKIALGLGMIKLIQLLATK